MIYTHVRRPQNLYSFKNQDPGFRFFSHTLFTGPVKLVRTTQSNGFQCRESLYTGFSMRDDQLKVYTQ